MSTPLYDAVRAYAAQDAASFHTPGHKGKTELLAGLTQAHDLTELPETDSLYHAEGVIAEAERLAARAFGAHTTAISAGGCTLAIQAMLRCVCAEGDTILAGRVIHRGAVNAMALLGLSPRWIYPDGSAGAGLPGRVTPEAVEELARRYPQARAVYITSPDYYGCMADIEGIAAVCKKYGMPLLVDNAHGTHLAAFGRHPLSLGAAMTADSAHKTLPVLTGGAWIHCADPKFSSLMKGAMSLFGSTSPSYPIMSSLDIAREWFEQSGIQAFAELAEQTRILRREAEKRGMGIPAGECDPVRFTILTQNIGLTGAQAAEHLRRCGCEPEYCDDAAAVMILTPFNTPEQLCRLRDAVQSMPAGDAASAAQYVIPRPASGCALREAALAAARSVPTAEAVGMISAQPACPCPPGVPVLMPGEVIDAQCADLLIKTGIYKLNVVN